MPYLLRGILVSSSSCSQHFGKCYITYMLDYLIGVTWPETWLKQGSVPTKLRCTCKVFVPRLVLSVNIYMRFWVIRTKNTRAWVENRKSFSRDLFSLRWNSLYMLLQLDLSISFYGFPAILARLRLLRRFVSVNAYQLKKWATFNWNTFFRQFSTI